jgi:hypothetical protein
LDQCICSPGFYHDEKKDNCVPCLEGAECPDYGHTLRSVQVQSEWWRISDNSTITLECDVNPRLCQGDRALRGENASLRPGGVHCDDPLTGSLCACHHTGPFCSVCTGGTGGRYRTLEGECRSCDLVNKEDVIGVIVGIVLFLVLGTFGSLYSAHQQVKVFA